MKSWIFIFSCFFLALSCQRAPLPQQKQQLRVNILSEPQSLDPRKARSLNSITIMHMLFEGLTRIGKEGSLELALATQADVSEDGRFYTFCLRKAFWSNGDPITSFDFAHSWRITLSPSFPASLAYQLFVLKGARAAKFGEISLDRVGIQTPDAHTLVVELEQPIPYFLELLTFPSFFPVSLQVDRANPHWAETPAHYVSNGPFSLESWSHSDEIRVVRNPSYWDAEQVSMEEISLIMVSPETELRLFTDKKLDWVGSPLSSLPIDAIAHLKKSEALQIRPLMGTYFLRVNSEDDSPLAHPLFRKSISLAIDRQKITDHILQGGQLPAVALVPPTMGLSSHGYFKDADEQEARHLRSVFQEIPSLTLLYAADERNHLIAQTLQQQIEQALDLSIKLEAVESKMFYERISKKQYQLAIGYWIADFNDPINFLEVFKYKESGRNQTGWEHPKYIERLTLSALCKDPGERKEFLREAEEILMEQMPVIPIFHLALNYLQSERVKNVCISPIGQIDFRWCHVDQNAL